MKSVLKWVGGKRQLLPELREKMPINYAAYHECFLGGGALFFDVAPEKAYVNDLNKELIDFYKVLKRNPNVLVKKVNLMHEQLKEDESIFYEIRKLDRFPGLENLNISFRAARMLFLNKAGYNGMYRVNLNNQNNVPYGKKVPNSFYDIDNLNEVSHFLNRADIIFKNQDFRKFLNIAKENDFVYLDPPYDPVSETAAFTTYQQEGFSQKDQIELRDKCIELHNRGVFFMLSNSDTKNIRELYAGFDISVVYAKRSINSDGTGRGEVAEVLIRNYVNVEDVDGKRTELLDIRNDLDF